MKFKLPRMVRVRNTWSTNDYFIEGQTYWMTHFDDQGFCDIKGKELSKVPEQCNWRIKRFEQMPLINQDKKGPQDED